MALACDVTSKPQRLCQRWSGLSFTPGVGPKTRLKETRHRYHTPHPLLSEHGPIDHVDTDEPGGVFTAANIQSLTVGWATPSHGAFLGHLFTVRRLSLT